MERVTLRQLFRHHRADVNAWPDDVRALLSGNTQARVAHGMETMQTASTETEHDSGERV